MGVLVKVSALLLLIAAAATITAEGRLDVSSMVAEVMNDGDWSSLLMKDTPNVPCCASCVCTKSDPPQCHCRGFTLRTHVCNAICPGVCACDRVAEPYTRCFCGATLPFCFPKCPSATA